MSKWACYGCETSKNECATCCRNYEDKFSTYTPTCKLGYEDCIHDPAYIFKYYPEWYKTMWGNKSLEEVKEISCLDCTEENCQYDDEDK